MYETSWRPGLVIEPGYSPGMSEEGVLQTRTQEEKEMARYLLGELPEVEQEAFEEKLFLDDDWFDRLRVVEMELIEDYVQGRMSAADRAQFERGFLTTPERAEKIANARALFRHAADLSPLASTATLEAEPGIWARLSSYFRIPNYAFQYAATAAVVVLTIGVLWLAYDRVSLKDQIELARNQQAKQAAVEQSLRDQRAAIEKQLESKQSELQAILKQSTGKDQEIKRLENEISALKQRRESVNVGEPGTVSTTFVGLGPKPRGDEPVSQPVTVHLSPVSKILSFHFELREPVLTAYDASLRTENGNFVRYWSKQRPRRIGRKHFFILRTPASLFTERNYNLTIHEAGIDHPAISAYHIEIIRP